MAERNTPTSFHKNLSYYMRAEDLDSDDESEDDRATECVLI